MSHSPGIHHCLGQLHEGEGGGGQSEYRFYEPALFHCYYIYIYNIYVRAELMVSLFIRCTMRCEIWAQPAELPR